jgi:hypothetical protein
MIKLLFMMILRGSFVPAMFILKPRARKHDRLSRLIHSPKSRLKRLIFVSIAGARGCSPHLRPASECSVDSR